MSVLKRVLTQGFLWLEQIRGNSIFSQTVVIQTGQKNSLRVIHRSGYDITIYCQRHGYEKHYAWWPRSKQYSVYYVFSTTTADAPQLIQEACKLEVTLPLLQPGFVDDEMQRHAIIDAYVDLIMERLRLLKQSSFI